MLAERAEKWPKIKVLRFANGLRHRLGLLERVPKLVSEKSGDSGKIEKIRIENSTHCHTVSWCRHRTIRKYRFLAKRNGF